MGGCGEANNGSGTTAGDWAVAVIEKANVKIRPHEKTIVENLKQFLKHMGTTFRAGTTRRAPKTSRAGLIQLRPNRTKENVGRAYSRVVYSQHLRNKLHFAPLWRKQLI